MSHCAGIVEVIPFAVDLLKFNAIIKRMRSDYCYAVGNRNMIFVNCREVFEIHGINYKLGIRERYGRNIRTGTVNSDPVRTVNTGQVKSNSLYFVLNITDQISQTQGVGFADNIQIPVSIQTANRLNISLPLLTLLPPKGI